MKTYRMFTFSITLVFISLMSACATNSKLEKKDYSGFLSDYSQLKSVKLDSGRKSFMWTHPDFKNLRYQKLILTPVSFYPEPHVQKNVDKEFLSELLAKINDRVLTMAQNDGLPLTDQAGSGTLQLLGAVTAIKADKKDFSVREIIPIRLLIAAVEMAAGGRDYEVTIDLEYKLIDSVSKKVLVRGFRQGNTESLANSKKKLTLKHTEELLDDWGMDFHSGFLKFTKIFHVPSGN